MRPIPRLAPVALLLLLAGCTSSTAPNPAAVYLCPGAGGSCSTASLLKDIPTAFTHLDIAGYTAELDDHFVFRTLPDLGSGHSDSLGRAVELSVMKHLFTDGAGGQFAMKKILLTVDTTSSSSDSRVGHEGWIRYIVQTHFVGTFPDGNEMHIDSPAWLYFRPAAAGTWKLAEWADQPPPGSPATRGAAGSQGSHATRQTTWTSLRYLYL